MSEQHARRLLGRVMNSFTTGSVLHLLADLHRTAAEESRKSDDAVAYDRHRSVERTLYVVGLGVDAAYPF